jgi:hypothetical protein
MRTELQNAIARCAAGESSHVAKQYADLAARARGIAEALEPVAVDAAAVLQDAELRAEAARADLVAHWRATGEGCHLLRGAVHFRATGDGRIVSTLGAEVSEAAGARLFRLIRATMASGKNASWSYGTGPSVGPFRVQRIDANGSAVVGCHEITAREVDNFSRLMGW